MTISFSSIVPLVAVAVISSGATFFVTKSVCSHSNSESQVVAYLKEKEAAEQVRIKEQLKADTHASEAWRQLWEDERKAEQRVQK